MVVEWDEEKAESNLEKHGVRFEDAAKLFDEENDFLDAFDEDHSIDEERYIAIGPTRAGVLTVVYTERGEETMRLISARRANSREVALFRRYMDSR